MDPFQPGTGLLPPTLRALALGLLVETVVPLLAQSREESLGSPGVGEGEAASKAELWHALRCKCGELSALVLRADDPEEAAAYVLGYLPRHFKYALEPAQGCPVTLSSGHPTPEHRPTA
jgi:hypothetical protein